MNNDHVERIIDSYGIILSRWEKVMSPHFAIIERIMPLIDRALSVEKLLHTLEYKKTPLINMKRKNII